MKHLGSSLAVAQHTAENLEKDFISKGSEATGLAEANAALNSEIDSLNATVEHLESSLAAAQHTADLLVVEREMLEFGFNRLIREKATLAVEAERNEATELAELNLEMEERANEIESLRAEKSSAEVSIKRGRNCHRYTFLI